ncbi:MAG TPA: LuxR C-terminal-related transcriptional regulator [Acidimicrobiales bacterium]|nr:LuxR C-terminal-related transcriptional regulator [Acidimicrobiales bacterium]
MSVFPGSFGFPAVEEVCRGGEVGPDDVLDLLSGVIAKSLVAGNTTGRAARYRLAETVRLYAALCLRAAGEAADVGERHARWCMRIVENAAEGGPGAPTLGELDAEVDNVHAALEWCVTHDRADLGLRLATAYVVVWRAAGRMAEAREWLLRVLAMGEGEPAALRARALYDAGFAALLLGDFDAARSHVEASLAASAEAADPPSLVQRTKGLLAMVSTLSEGRGGVDELERRVEEARARDDPHLAEALVGCGHARLFRGEPVAALAHFDELVAVSRRRGNLATLATGLVGAGTAALGQGDCRRAGDRLREGIAVATATADVHTEVIGRISLAELARLTADLEGARGQLEECLARAGPMGAPYPVALARLGLARTVLEQGHAEAARRHFQEALAVAGRARLGHVEAAALEGLGEAVLALGDGRTADELFERALAVARECAERTATARATSALAERGRARGDRARASAGHHDALRVFHQVGARPGVVDSLEALGGLALDGDSLARAARLFGAAAAMRDAGGWARRARAQDRHPADLARLQERMGRQELEEAWAAGAALGGDQAVAYASRGRGQRTGATRGPESLTRAEREVVALAVERLTTDEIAGRLFISPRTVHSHLRRVYAKLGVTSRRELRERTVGDRTPG